MADLQVDNADTGSGTYYVSMGAGAINADRTQRFTIATDDSLTSAIKTATEATSTSQIATTAHLATLAGAVSGTEVQVDIVSNSAASTEYTEDAAAPSDPDGPTIIFRRTDTLSSSEVTANGDWIGARATNKGELYVKQTDPVQSAANQVNSASESTGAVTTGSTTILSSNSSRKGGYIQNESDTDVWISLGGTATTAAPSSKIRGNGGSLSLVIDGSNVYTGAITAIHGGSGTKNLSIVEL